MRFAQIGPDGRPVVFLDGKAGDFPDLEKAGVLKPATVSTTTAHRWDGAKFVLPPAKVQEEDPIVALVRKIVAEELAKVGTK